jgi:hypothetical protein
VDYSIDQFIDTRKVELHLVLPRNRQKLMSQGSALVNCLVDHIEMFLQ